MVQLIMNLKAVCSCPFMPVAVQHLFYVRALVVIDQHPYSECLGLASYVAPAPQYEQYAGYAVSQPVPIAPTGYAPVQNTKDNPPCNTLFIGNLGEAVNETELRGLFSRQALTPTLHTKSITIMSWEAEFMNTSPSLTRS
jgi:hypothetical protein